MWPRTLVVMAGPRPPPRCLSSSRPRFLVSSSAADAGGRKLPLGCRLHLFSSNKSSHPGAREKVVRSRHTLEEHLPSSPIFKLEGASRGRCNRDTKVPLLVHDGRAVRILLTYDLEGSRAGRRTFSADGKQPEEEVPGSKLRQERRKEGGSGGDAAAETYSAMEPDFVSYLTGEAGSPPSEEEKDNGRSSLRPKRRKRLIHDPDKELYKQIRKMQNLQKEKTRQKTATNVHRALWGNVVICGAKLGAWASSGSSGMFAEFVHSVVDCGNQALLLVGLRDAGMVADRKHPYGYGKSVYFWALVSALGTFFLGAGVSMTSAVGNVMNPSLHEVTWQVWGVLALSFTVDGYVFRRTLSEIMETKPDGVSYWQQIKNVRDPATLAILLEDGAACLGVVIALGGIVASHATANPVFDGFAGVGISALLGFMGLALVKVNHRFLLGHAVDRDITDGIQEILLSRRSIDNIGQVQSQWTGPDTFSYKAEVDFDGTYLAAKLMPVYREEFLKIRDSMEDELSVLLAFFAEDVIRTVEREVRHAEAQIRKRYPGAEFIELEPMSLDVDRLAIDDNLEAGLRRVESESLNRYLKTLKKEGGIVEQQAATPDSGASNNTELK